jgi:hypothetical protein
MNLMRRLLIFIFSLLTASIISRAQDNGFETGFLFNANRCIFHGDANIFLNNNKYNKMHIGYLHVSEGMFVKRNFSEKYYGKIELRYIPKGSVVVYAINAYNNENDWESIVLKYLDVPVLFGYKLRTRHNFILFETGIAYSKLIDIKASQSSFFTDNDLLPQLATFKKNDISWVGEIQFPLNRQRRDNLFLGFRFSHSIFTVNNIYKVYNSLYGLECEYLIKKKK